MSKKDFSYLILAAFIGAGLSRLMMPISAESKGPVRAERITASSFDLVDAQGRIRAQLSFATQGPPGLFLMDEKGVARLTLGLYEDGTGHVVLNDKNGSAVQILRSYGPRESPLHIFKTQGQDKMIIGLNPDADPVPFLMHYDAKQSRSLVFGKYTGP